MRKPFNVEDLPETLIASEAVRIFRMGKSNIDRWARKGQIAPIAGSKPARFLTADIVAIITHPSYRARDLGARFWNKVEKTEGCWLWIGRLFEEGYGQIKYEGRSYGAHRWGYERLVGPIPEGLELDHLCRVRRCVNPDHLEPVTHRVNTMRGVSESAKNAAKTHCKNDHEFTPDNTRMGSQGNRICKTCDRDRGAAYRQQRAMRVTPGDAR